MSTRQIVIDGESLTIDQVVSVARNNTKVKLSVKAENKVKTAAKLVHQWIDSGEVIYGVTTGFGPFSEVVISDDKAKALQHNLIISHAAGVGNPLATEVVRAAMLLRANTLAKGFSGIRLSTLQLLVDLINKGVHPIIPEKGSVGASGDLAPLSHMVLVLIGEGEAEYKGDVFSGAEALKRAKLTPIELGPKEGIALINGTQIMTAIATLVTADARNLLASAEIAAALSMEALEAVLDAFDKQIHKARPHPGQLQTANNLSTLLAGSSQVLTSRERAKLAQKALKTFHDSLIFDSDQDREATELILQQIIHTVIAIDKQLGVETPDSAKGLIKKRTQLQKHLEKMGVSKEAFEAAIVATRTTQRVQDAYSIRCTPQVLGTARDAITHAEQVVSVEINSATDNPLIFPQANTFLSGGNFHGQPIATVMDYLAIALTSIGSIAERRIARLIDDKLSNGLPLLLTHPKLADQGVHFGLGLAQLTAAALTAECQILATPASIRSIPTAANQEDHVSMGTIAARHAREILSNIEHIIAIEYLCATQGIDIRRLSKTVRLGKGSQIAYDVIRNAIPRYTMNQPKPADRLTQDFLLHHDINRLWDLVHSAEIVKSVHKGVTNTQF
ncbi:MAG: histidine ammonia-lyase [Promethearchaeota archaeon]